MKATGIVRRIDDLGRIVLPKEIRRTLHIYEGTPMEIFPTEDGSIVLKKYMVEGDILEQLECLGESIDDLIEMESPEKASVLRRHISEMKNILEQKESPVAGTTGETQNQ